MAGANKAASSPTTKANKAKAGSRRERDIASMTTSTQTQGELSERPDHKVMMNCVDPEDQSEENTDARNDEKPPDSKNSSASTKEAKSSGPPSIKDSKTALALGSVVKPQAAPDQTKKAPPSQPKLTLKPASTAPKGVQPKTKSVGPKSVK